MILKIYSDGACWGNPGHSAIAFMILDQHDKLLKEHSEYIGIGTNNQAEYKALIQALRSALDFGNEAICYSDSVLVVEQVSGNWRVKHSNMRPLWREAIALKERFRKISFVHVPRTDRCIERIDQLANQELDKVSNTTVYNLAETKVGRQEVLQVREKPNENILLEETNKGSYTLKIIAKFEDPYPVTYIIRVSTPEGTEVDYISTLEGFKNIGELLTALHYFAKTKLYPKDTIRLQEVLTAESIKSFAEVLKAAKFSV